MNNTENLMTGIVNGIKASHNIYTSSSEETDIVLREVVIKLLGENPGRDRYLSLVADLKLLIHSGEHDIRTFRDVYKTLPDTLSKEERDNALNTARYERFEKREDMTIIYNLRRMMRQVSKEMRA